MGRAGLGGRNQIPVRSQYIVFLFVFTNIQQDKVWFGFVTFPTLQPLELLHADNVLSDDLHGLGAAGVLELPHHLRRLLALLLGRLHGDELVAVHLDDRLHLPTVRSRLLELLVQLELQLHRLEDGGGLDQPVVAVLSDFHDGRGGGGGLPQQEVDAEGGEEFIVLLGAGPFVLSQAKRHGWCSAWGAVVR